MKSHPAQYRLKMFKYVFRLSSNRKGVEPKTQTSVGTSRLNALDKLTAPWRERGECLMRQEVTVPLWYVEGKSMILAMTIESLIKE